MESLMTIWESNSKILYLKSICFSQEISPSFGKQKQIQFYVDSMLETAFLLRPTT